MTIPKAIADARNRRERISESDGGPDGWPQRSQRGPRDIGPRVIQTITPMRIKTSPMPTYPGMTSWPNAPISVLVSIRNDHRTYTSSRSSSSG